MLQTRISPSRTSAISLTVFTTRATPSTTPGDAGAPLSSESPVLAPRPRANAFGRDAPEHVQHRVVHLLGHGADGGRRSPVREPLEDLLAARDDRRPVLRAERLAARGPHQHELVEGRCNLVPGELEDVLGILEVAVRPRAARRTRAPCSTTSSGTSSRRGTCAPRRTGRPCRERPSSSSKPLRVSSSRSAPYSCASRSRSRASSSVGRSTSSPSLQRAHIADERRVRDARVVEPAAVVVVEPVARGHVEPRVLHLLELLEPALPASLRASSSSISSGERPSTNAESTPVSTASRASRLSSASGLNRSTSIPATICAMCWSGMSGRRVLAEVDERGVGAVAEQQELAVVLPHELDAAHAAARRRRGPRRTPCCGRPRTRPRRARTPAGRAREDR